MKVKILQSLKNKYTKLGYSDKALDGLSDYLAKTVTEEDKIDDATTAAESLLQVFQGEIDKRTTVAVKKAKEELLKKKDSDDDDTPTPPAPPDDTPAWAKALVKSHEQLASELLALKSEKNHGTLHSKLVAKLKEKDIDESFYEPVLSGREFKEEAQIDALFTSIESAHVKHLQSLTDKGLLNTGKPIIQQSPNGKANPTIEEMAKEKLGNASTGSLAGKLDVKP